MKTKTKQNNYYVYRLDHTETGEFYIGSRGCKCTPEEDTKYLGSMCAWKPDKSKLKKTILKIGFSDRTVTMSYEAALIKEHIDDSLNRNYFIPGSGFHVNGMVSVKDKDGNTSCVSVQDPRYLSGELISVHKGKVSVKDKDGNKLSVSIHDPRYLSGELKHVFTGTVVTKNKYGNKLSVSIHDPRYLSGELVSFTKYTSIVKDKDGNKFRVDSDDTRLLSGELVGHTKGFTSVMYKNGMTFSVPTDDPRLISGELVGSTKGLVMAKDKDNKSIQVSKNDPRLMSGELTHINKGRIRTKDKNGKRFNILDEDPRLISGELMIYSRVIPNLEALDYLEDIKNYLKSENKTIFTIKELRYKFINISDSKCKNYMWQLVKYEHITKLKTNKPKLNGFNFKLSN